MHTEWNDHPNNHILGKRYGFSVDSIIKLYYIVI